MESTIVDWNSDLDDRLHEVCERVRTHMIDELRKEQAPWIKPWSGISSIVYGGERKNLAPYHANLRTPEKPYGPMNQLYLDAQRTMNESNTKHDTPNLYITNRRIKDLELKILYGDPYEIVGIVPASGPYPWGIRTWEIWHVGQIEKWEEKLGVRLMKTKCVAGIRKKRCISLKDKLIEKYDLSVEESEFNEGAFYRIDEDRIYVPSIDRFSDSDGATAENHYWATLWHEVVHWTGHMSRLARDGLRVRDTIHYAQEELVAEMGSTLLCAMLGVRGELQHASYIKSWLRYLEEQRATAIFTMMMESQKAIEWIVGSRKTRKKIR